MKALLRSIDRFCVRHPRFGIPNLMLLIVIGNAIVFLFSIMDTTNSFIPLLLFSPHLILQGQIWRVFTFIFVPETSQLLFLALFLYFYYFIGRTLENTWGSGKFTIFYSFGIILTILYGFIAGLLLGPASTIFLDAHYINLSMFFAYATFYPDNRVLLLFFIPIKIKWLALINLLYFLYSIFINPFPLSLLPLVAMLNYALFCGETLLSYFAFFRNRISPRAINFKRAAKKAARNHSHSSASNHFTRKCSVCGRTDADSPNLEFRFCSRCEGYHCFCIDHINSHIHFR